MDSTRGRFSARVITKSSKNTFRKLFSSHEVDAIILPPGTDFKINLENNYNGLVYCQIFRNDDYIGTWKLGPHKNGFVLNQFGKNQWFNFGRNIENIRVIFYPDLPSYDAIEHNVYGQLYSIPLPPTSASNHFKKYKNYTDNKTFMHHTAPLPKLFNLPNNFNQFTDTLSYGPSYAGQLKFKNIDKINNNLINNLNKANVFIFDIVLVEDDEEYYQQELDKLLWRFEKDQLELHQTPLKFLRAFNPK